MLPPKPPIERAISARIGLLLIALTAVGFWLRVRNLGALGLELDEGHQALAVRGILEHGLPRVPSGDLYSRGWPFLYLEAAAAAVLGLSEFALRLPGVLFGTASIGMIYLLGARVFSRGVGLLAAAIFTFSIWEIEFARYARMYTAFQFAYLIALYNFYRGYVEGERTHQVLLPFAAAFAISLHALGVMLATLFVIPFLLRRYTVARPAALVLNAASIGIFWIGYTRLIRVMNPTDGDASNAVESALLPGEGFLRQVAAAAASVVREDFNIPPLGLVRELGRDAPMLLALAAALVLIACGYLAWTARRAAEPRLQVLLIAALVAVGLHQFGLALAVVAAALFLYWDRLVSLERGLMLAWSAAVALLAAFWWAVASDARLAAADLERAEAFFAYPVFYRYFLRWYWEGWPRLTIAVVVALGLLSYRAARGHGPGTCLFVAGAVLLPALATSFLRSPFYEARYTFHLYPVVVLIGAYLLVEAAAAVWRWAAAREPSVSRWRAPGVALLAFVLALVVTQDINPIEAHAIGERSYRSPRDKIRAHINWEQYAVFHQDHRGPALYVRANMQPGDKVVVFGPPHRASLYQHYIGQVDGVVSEVPERLYSRRRGRLVHYMTGSDVIRRFEDLERLIAAPRDYRIWILSDRQLLGAGVKLHSAEAKAAMTRWLETADPGCEGQDGVTFCVAL